MQQVSIQALTVTTAIAITKAKSKSIVEKHAMRLPVLTTSSQV